MTKIKPCSCSNAYQDLKYGKHMRVHNPTIKPKPQWRCTVCKNVKD